MRRAGHQPNPKLQPSANDGGGSIGLLRCQVPRCGGYMHQDTDGNGRTIEWCTECERRIGLVRQLQAAKLVVREVVREIPTPQRIEVVREVLRYKPVQLEQAASVEWVLREQLDTPGRIAREYRVSRMLLFRAISEGRVRAIYYGDRVVLVWRESVEAWRKSVRKYRRRAPADEEAQPQQPDTSAPLVTGNTSTPIVVPLGDQAA